MLAAIGDEHLISSCLKSTVTQGLDGDRFTQLGKSGRGRVAMHLRITTGLHCCLDDVLGSREVGLAGAETNDVLAGRFEGLGFGIDGQCGRFSNGCETRRCALALG